MVGWQRWRLRRRPAARASENRDVNLDIGETVQVQQWQPDGTASVELGVVVRAAGTLSPLAEEVLARITATTDYAALADADLVIDCRGLAAKDQLPNLRGVRGELVWLHAPGLVLQRPLRLLQVVSLV